ncbi:MAG TPA: patatin-like phospholipase family protein [Bacillota bacterium]|nr:patatin-like phospholipase family protein [Bacillota bacterium]
MRRALILSGGGCKGAFEVGAIDYLINSAKLDYQIFIGSSVGALNAAILGLAGNYQELVTAVQKLKQLWEEIRGNRSIYQPFPLGILDLFKRNGLFDPAGLRQLIHSYIDPHQLCHNPAKFVLIPTVSIETGELFYADSRNPDYESVFLKYILASASVPFFFPPVTIGDKHWYDGCLRDVTPLSAAFKEQPDEITVVLTFPVNDDLEPVLSTISYGGVLKSLLRIVSIMTNEISTNDLQISKYINQRPHFFLGRKRVPIKIIAPKTHLQGTLLDFSPQKIRENIRLGYEAAQEYKTLIVNN